MQLHIRIPGCCKPWYCTHPRGKPPINIVDHSPSALQVMQSHIITFVPLPVTANEGSSGAPWGWQDRVGDPRFLISFKPIVEVNLFVFAITDRSLWPSISIALIPLLACIHVIVNTVCLMDLFTLHYINHALMHTINTLWSYCGTPFYHGTDF